MSVALLDCLNAFYLVQRTVMVYLLKAFSANRRILLKSGN